MTEPDNKSPSSMSPGEQLRAARMGYQWAIEDVAANLNLTVQVVKALEEGDHTNLPESAFVRGYLRAYARLMEIDENLVLKGSAESSPDHIGSVVPLLGKEAFSEKKDRQWLRFSQKKNSSWRKPAVWTIIVVIAIIATWWFSGLLPTFNQLMNESRDQSNPSGTITIPLNNQN
ncbi:helix-turn-helix transcriptional regulator [Gammaproteobacteria bacterium]|nr:helix-turn-helix transcriptional regulator [Gammaproteobacteria bacterium]